MNANLDLDEKERVRAARKSEIKII